MAEVYWDLEWALQQQGFDYTYDKRLYDRLVRGEALPVRQHLLAGWTSRIIWRASFREPRRAARRATFNPDIHRVAAVITFLTPGLRFFHRDNVRASAPASDSPGAGPAEPLDEGIAAFYDDLLTCLKDEAFRNGDWKLLEARPAWEGNESNQDFVAFS